MGFWAEIPIYTEGSCYGQAGDLQALGGAPTAPELA